MVAKGTRRPRFEKAPLCLRGSDSPGSPIQKMAEEKVMTVKRFGARYGRKIRYKVAKIEEELKKKHKCPYCSSLRAKRIAAGIWGCRKCGAKFTGKAYSIAKRVTFEEEIPEESKEAQKEEKAEEAEDKSSKKKKEEKRW